MEDHRYVLDILKAQSDEQEKRQWIAIVVLSVALVIAAVAHIVDVQLLNRRWQETVQKANTEWQETVKATNEKWLDCISEYDFVSYEQDGEGVNIIGDRNGVKFDVTESEDPGA